jgi:hypothetical protein
MKSSPAASFDAVTFQEFGAHAYGQIIACICKLVFRHTKGMHLCIYQATNINCRGSGGQQARPAGSAWGGARSHP